MFTTWKLSKENKIKRKKKKKPCNEQFAGARRCLTQEKLSNHFRWWGRVIFCGDRSYI